MKPICLPSSNSQPIPRDIRQAADAEAPNPTIDLPDWDPEDLQRIAAKLRSISLFGFSAAAAGNATSPAGQPCPAI